MSSITEAQNSPFFKSYAALEKNKFTRNAIISDAALLEYTAKEEGLFPPGTVTVIIGKKGNEIISSIKAAHQTGDRSKLQSIADQIIGDFSKRSAVSLPEAADLVMNSEVFCEVSYGGKVVGSYIS